MNGGDDKGDTERILGTRANGQSSLPVAAARAPNVATLTTNTNGAFGKENKSAVMATGGHSRKHSASSLSEMPLSPDVTRIPRPTPRPSPRVRRRSLTLDEAFDLAEHRRAIGSPSPAPRPSRQPPTNLDNKPLPNMFSQRPIDLGRLGRPRPGSSLSFGSSTRQGDEPEDAYDRKLKQFEEDEKIIKSMKEDKKGLFVKPKFGINGAGTRTASARGSFNGNLGNSNFGNGNTGGNAPRQTWGNLHDNNPNWLKKFEPALKVAAEEDARRGIAGAKRKSPSASPVRPSIEQKSPFMIQRPATAQPLRSPDKSYAWQVDEDFTAGDLQVSNSPPVGFGRGNTKLDELRKLEINAELDNPVDKQRFAPQRTNTKLDEILQREREAERKFPIPHNEEPTTESVGGFAPSAQHKPLFSWPRPAPIDVESSPVREVEGPAPSADHKPLFSWPRPTLTDGESSPVREVEVSAPRAEHKPWFSWPRPAPTDGESSPVREVEAPAPRAPAMTRMNSFGQQQAARPPSPEVQRKMSFGLSHRRNPPANLQAKIPSFGHGFGDLEGEKVPDSPVTIFRKPAPEQPIKEQNEPQRNGVQPADPGKADTVAKEDPHDLLRRLARASSKSPSPSPVQEKPEAKYQEGDKAALPGTSEGNKQDEQIVSNDKGTEVKDIFPAPLASTNKFSMFSRPTVGFAGLPRSASTKSVRSAQSRTSADPTARIEAEMNLFADNMSERGSTRPSSPKPASESEPGVGGNSADVTPKPPKFDPVSMPTPQVTGAYVETPVPLKFEQPVVKMEPTILERKSFPPRKRFERQNRDISTSPRAIKSDGQREHVRSASMSKLRRSKSLPRRNLPLKNSVKIPTVKEDLEQIHLLNNIEDSTLDDFTDLLISSSNPEELQEILNNGVDGFAEMDDSTFDHQLKRFDQLGRSLNAGLAGIRQAKKGIERLENRVSNSEKSARAMKTEGSEEHSTGHSTHHAHDPGCPHCVGVRQKRSVAYIHMPLPRLYHTQPRIKPTLLGFCLLLLASWFFLENSFYERWGRQYVCYRGSPCHYDVDDPDWGYVVPVKLDEWLTGGTIRPYAAHWMEEFSDYVADAQDWWTGTEIHDIDWRAIRDPDRRRAHFRRMDKKNLWPEWNPAPEMIPVIDDLERQRLTEEAAEESYYLAQEYIRKEGMGKDDVLSRQEDEQQFIRWF